jgi:acyl-CoA thioester hydrolase
MTFTYTNTVCFGDTDAYGMAYYAQYLYWLEAARLAFLEHLGCPHKLFTQLDTGLVVVKADINYKTPLRLEDKFKLHFSLGQIKSASFELHHQFWRENTLINEGTITLAAVDLKSQKPKRLPAELVDCFKANNLLR